MGQRVDQVAALSRPSVAECAALHWQAQALQLAAHQEVPLPVLREQEELDDSKIDSEEEGTDASSPVVSPDMISVGSAMHGQGKCKPCAWFWKPQSCQSGMACAHCHLCPKDELKERKKAKESAMRAGTLVPKRQTQGSKPSELPRVVRIAPSLGA